MDICYLDLENPRDARRLEQPMDAVRHLEGLVVVDEVQRRAGLFPALRVLIDRSDAPGQYLGSASPCRTSSSTHYTYPGEHRFNLERGIEAVPLWALLRLPVPLK